MKSNELRRELMKKIHCQRVRTINSINRQNGVKIKFERAFCSKQRHIGDFNLRRR